MKMKESDWSNIKYFTKNEKWGDWTMIESEVIYKLDAMRKYCGKRIVLHCGYEIGGHTQTSQHYVGRAVDLHIVGVPLIDQFLIAERFGWKGLGIYPDWRNQGLHLDMREGEVSRWGQKTIDGIDTYVALDGELIKYVLRRSL